jgi:RNA polymerase sigma-70 factor (ECF subfamily)
MLRARRRQERYAVSRRGEPQSEATAAPLGALRDAVHGNPLADVKGLDDAIRDDLSRLWTEHHAFLKGMARQWLRAQQSDIDDVLNDVMLRAGTVLALGQEIVTSERAWLSRLLYNRCVDLYRRRRSSEEFATLSQTGLMPEHTSGGRAARSGEQQLLRRELTIILMEAVHNLPAGLREPVIMRLVDDIPYNVIARTLGLTQVNVRKRVQLGRGLLRESLAVYLRTGRPGNSRLSPGDRAQ